MGTFHLGSFHIIHDLAPLIHMIKVMSLKLSDKARQRVAWMDAYRECGNAAQVCRHFSIPLRTFWRWRKRYDPWDLKSLEHQSKKPHQSPRKIPWAVEHAVLAMKRAHPRWGKEKLALALARNGITISGKTCYRICKRHSLVVRYRTRKRKPPKPRVNWAEIRLPGDLIQMDTKHIFLQGKPLFQYTAIDVISKVRHAEIFPHADMATTAIFLGRILPVLKPRMIQTDNGSEFGRQVSAWLRDRSIRHVFSHVHRPQENAYVERSHRIDEEEFYSVEPLGATLEELRVRFARYLKMYNEERPHWGLNGKTPMEFLTTYLLKEPCHMS